MKIEKFAPPQEKIETASLVRRMFSSLAISSQKIIVNDVPIFSTFQDRIVPGGDRAGQGQEEPEGREAPRLCAGNHGAVSPLPLPAQP